MSASGPSKVAAALRGPMVPLVTPYTDELEIDWPGFDGLVERLLAAGSKVLLAADLVGEAWALTIAEKEALYAATARAAGGRALVVAKLSEPALANAQQLARAAGQAGAAAVKVVLPAGVRPRDDEAYDYLTAAVAPAALPFLVETNGEEVSLAVLRRLAEREDFVGVEETSQDAGRYGTLKELLGPRVAVICGAEDVLGQALRAGAHGFMTASPNFAPAFMASLWAAAAARDWERLAELQARLGRFRALFRADLAAGRPAFAPYAKAALALLGHPVGPPRPPLSPLTASEQAELRAVLAEALGLRVA